MYPLLLSYCKTFRRSDQILKSHERPLVGNQAGVFLTYGRTSIFNILTQVLQIERKALTTHVVYLFVLCFFNLTFYIFVALQNLKKEKSVPFILSSKQRNSFLSGKRHVTCLIKRMRQGK